MHSRQGIIELFSTFLEFEADCFKGWTSDPRLRRSMHICLDRLPQFKASEKIWTLYWYKLWQAHPDGLAERHLIAYLQELLLGCQQNGQILYKPPISTI